MIKAPRTSRASLVKGSSKSVGNTEAQRALIAHWQGIVKSLGSFLNTLKSNHVSIDLYRMWIRLSFPYLFISWSTFSFYTGSSILGPESLYTNIFFHQRSTIQQVS